MNDAPRAAKRPAFLDAYKGEWVAVKDGAVVAHAVSSVALAAMSFDRDAVVQYVFPPSRSWRVGAG